MKRSHFHIHLAASIPKLDVSKGYFSINPCSKVLAELHKARFLWRQPHSELQHPSLLHCRRPEVQSQHPRCIRKTIQTPVEMLGIAP